jgi:RimJ/RimL family protein N-acetyltransferase
VIAPDVFCDQPVLVGQQVRLEPLTVNPRARRVYEKCGFVLEGRLRDALHWGGRWHDELVMSVLRTDPRHPPEANDSL